MMRLIASNRKMFSGEYVGAMAIFLAVVVSVLIASQVYVLLIFPLGISLLVLAAAFFWCREDRSIMFLYYAFAMYFIFSIGWPRYVALWLPGLPSLNPQRFANLLLLVALIFGGMSVKQFVNSLRLSFAQNRFFWGCIFAYVTCRLVSILVSSEMVFSAYQFINEMVVHVVCVFVGAFVGANFGVLKKSERILVILLVFVSVVAIFEWSVGHNLFARFVDPSNDYLRWATSDKTRGGSYRSQSTLGFPITLAQFLVVSFALSYGVFAQSKIEPILRWSIWLCLAAVVCFAVYAAGSRSGYAGFVFVLLCLPFGNLIISFLKGKMTLSSAVLWIMFVSFSVFLAYFAFLFVYEHAFGARADAGSNALRELQLLRARELFYQSPILGFGTGRAAEVIGVATYSGQLTVDNLFVTILVESGFVCLLSFVLAVLCGAVNAFKKSITCRVMPDTWWSLCLAISVFSLFFPILSLQDNNYLLFFLMGCSVSVGSSDDGFI